MDSAFLFPGQGSQSVGMLDSFAEEYPQIEKTFADASEVLGYDLWHLLRNGPQEELANTAVTQPLMLSAGVAVWRIWCDLGLPRPVIMAGHSLGEYTALVCAESISFDAAVRLVRMRGEFMQEAVPLGEGGMVALIGPSAAEVSAFCGVAARGECLSVANFNSPVQTVVAGASGALDRLRELAAREGVKKMVSLPTSAPFHCAMMEPAAERLTPHIAELEVLPPVIPVMNNVDLRLEQEPEKIKHALIRQIASPVRWVELVERIVARGCNPLVECGPGKVLTGLNKRIAPTVDGFALFDVTSLQKVVQFVREEASD